ncbi:methyltransferase [Thermostilla marina]
MTGDEILQLTEGYQAVCVLGAAAELGLFDAIDEAGTTLDALCARLAADRRGLRILCDALAALGVLDKAADGRYLVPEDSRPYLREESPRSVVPMILHRMNILRGWSQLAWTVRAGIPAPRTASIRGCEADRRAFIRAMDVVTRDVADELVAKLAPLDFKRLIDVGGASGTWTFAFLRAHPRAKAVIFDLPHAIAEARRRVESQGMSDRVELVAGDFYCDPLPGGDFAWVSAIVHMHSREHNRRLYRKVFEALTPGGRIAVRDIVMQADRVHPTVGAMFAVNMLANTASGDTFTFDEFREDLEQAGFTNVVLQVPDEGMNAVVCARKPSA